MDARDISLAGIALSLLAAGCAVPQGDFETLREQVRQQQRQIGDLKARQEEQDLRVEALNNGFRILTDKTEENARRLDEREESAWAAPPAPASPAPPTAPDTTAPRETAARPPVPAPVAVAAPAPPAAVPAPPPAPPQAPAPTEAPILLTNRPQPAAPEAAPGELITAAPRAEKLYAGALTLYSGRDYQQAAVKFQEFVADYPDHKLAGNAQYWIGECYYSQKRFAEAAEEFAAVEKNYPASPKVPAALFKRALSLAELKRVPEARAALQRVVDRYPQSEEAAKAKDRMKLLTP